MTAQDSRNGFSDYRDTIVALDHVCLTALRARLDPFEAIQSMLESLASGERPVPAAATLERYLDPERQSAMRRSAQVRAIDTNRATT